MKVTTVLKDAILQKVRRAMSKKYDEEINKLDKEARIYSESFNKFKEEYLSEVNKDFRQKAKEKGFEFNVDGNLISMSGYYINPLNPASEKSRKLGSKKLDEEHEKFENIILAIEFGNKKVDIDEVIKNELGE